MTDETETEDTHPSFALASFARVHATPGVSLFDSEIRHREFVRLSITRASRRRMLAHDWLHAGLTPVIEVAMSVAQFGALVSSFGAGSGVPVTLSSVEGENIEEPPYAPRTAESLKEIGTATDRLLGPVTEEVVALRKAFAAGAGRRELGARIRDLEMSVENAKPNAKYLASTFTEHIETVVTKARADIEATAQRAVASGAASTDLLGLSARVIPEK